MRGRSRAAVLAEGGRLDLILLTHHHDDHIAGVEALRARFDCQVAGNAPDARRLPRLDQALGRATRWRSARRGRG